MCMLVAVRPSGPLVLLLIFLFFLSFSFLLLFQVLKKLQHHRFYPFNMKATLL